MRQRTRFQQVASLLRRLMALSVMLVCAPSVAMPLYRCLDARGGRTYTALPPAKLHCERIDGEAPIRPYASTLGSVAPVQQRSSAFAAPAALPRARQKRGAVYRILRRDGSVEYTNRLAARPASGSHVARLFSYIETCLACDLHSKLDFASLQLQWRAYAQAIDAASAEYGVDTALLRAVIQAESGFNPYAVSTNGAAGLMQLMPATAAQFGVVDVYDAEQNIRGGTRYLASLLRTFHGDKALATAAYNAGPQAVRRYGGLPPYPETQVYVQRVGLLWTRYRRFPAGSATPLQ